MIEITKHITAFEVFFKEELASKIIRSMQETGEALLLHNDGNFCYHECGFYNFLDALANYWKWNKEDIVLVTMNVEAYHNEYSVIAYDHLYPALFTNIMFGDKTWNHKFKAGVVIGKPSPSRFYTIRRLIDSIDANNILFNTHCDLLKIGGRDLAEVMNLNNDISMIDLVEKTRPRSTDGYFGDTLPISYKLYQVQFDDKQFSKYYDSIGVDIVAETSVSGKANSYSEKTFRPMVYQTPFIMVGQPGSMNKLKKDGYYVFDDVIPMYYDEIEDTRARIDAVIQILENLTTEQIEKVYKNRDGLLHNQNKFKQRYIENTSESYKYFNKVHNDTY